MAPLEKSVIPRLEGIMPDIKITHKYDDIIDLVYPDQKKNNRKHPPMDIRDRAKLFLPFAALKGYDEAIQEKQKIYAYNKELSEDEKQFLSMQLAQIKRELETGNRPDAKITYFEPNPKYTDGRGEFKELSGSVCKVNETGNMLEIAGERIPFSLITDISQ